jgi:hypothetical protein
MKLLWFFFVFSFFLVISNNLEVADCICKYYYFNTCVSPLFTIPVLQSSNFIKCSRNFGFTGQCFNSSFLPSVAERFLSLLPINFYKDDFVLQRFFTQLNGNPKMTRLLRHRRLGILKGSCFCAER